MRAATLIMRVGQIHVSTLDRDGLEMLLSRLFSDMSPVRSRISRKPNLLNDVSAEMSGEMLVVLAAKVLALEAKSRRRERMVRGKADRGRGRVRWKGKKARGGASRHRQNDDSPWPQLWVPPAALRRVT